MANEHLATYLNDHLAGSVTAIELLAHLEKSHKNCDSSTSKALPTERKTNASALMNAV